MSVNWKCFQCRKGSVEPFHKVNPLELIKFHLASMQALVPWSVTTPQLTITKCHRMAWSMVNGTGTCIHLTWTLHPVIQRWSSHNRSTSEKKIHPREFLPSKTSSLGLNGWLVLTLLRPRDSGYFLYSSNSLTHPSWVHGRRRPSKRQSVMDKPLPDKRVYPAVLKGDGM